MQIKFKLLCLLTAAMLLAGCSARDVQSPDAPQPSAPTNPAAPTSPEAPTPPDDTATQYYNDYLRMTLTLFADGTCTLRSADTDAAGTYSAFPGGVTLDFGTRQETAYEGENGDLTIEGRSGWFLRDWEFWGIDAAETELSAPAATVSAARSREVLANPDGSFRIRDYARELACSCAAGIELLDGDTSAPLTLSDGNGAYVTGRNITAALAASDGDAAAYLTDQLQTQLLADFTRLYGPVTAQGELAVRESEIDGRLAEAEMHVSAASAEVDIHAIVYTSAYADGTVNYICKCYFVPAGDAGRMAQLAETVSEMSAVRLKTEF